MYTIPSIALFGFLIPITGIGDPTAIVALTVYALLPMVRNTYTGLTTIDPAIIEAARGMGSTDRQLLYRIELPLAAPVIMSGIRNMATMTIALAGIATFIGRRRLGRGHLPRHHHEHHGLDLGRQRADRAASHRGGPAAGLSREVHATPPGAFERTAAEAFGCASDFASQAGPGRRGGRGRGADSGRGVRVREPAAAERTW